MTTTARLALLVLLAAAAAPLAAQDAAPPAEDPFARRGHLALTAEVLGTGTRALSGAGLRYWVADRTALALDVSAARLDLGSFGDDDVLRYFVGSYPAQSAGLAVEQRLRDLWGVVAVTARARVYAGRHEGTSTDYPMAFLCDAEPCQIVQFVDEGTEEAQTVGGSLEVGYEVRVYRGLTAGVFVGRGVARSTVRQERVRSLDGEVVGRSASDRAFWHATRPARLHLSVLF